MIPEDRHGAVGTERFRRTLAWHIARRPGGLIAPSRAAATALPIHAAGLPTTFEDTRAQQLLPAPPHSSSPPPPAPRPNCALVAGQAAPDPGGSQREL
ncbi:hypothetical protein ACFRCW_33180, partial [Streptomyces sp. NPDC056653]